MNSDGKVDILDLIRIINIILDIGPVPTTEEQEAADLNNDGRINISDLIIIINIILGIG